MSFPTFNKMDSWADTELKTLSRDLERLGLFRNVAELDLYGFTVIDASKTGAQEACERARKAAMRLHEKRRGVVPDEKEGSTHRTTSAPVLWRLVHEDPAFEELMLNPYGLALVEYLVGRRAMLSESAIFMKGPHGKHDAALSVSGKTLQLGMHADYILRPEPFPSYAEECNLTFLLTDYSVANGALALVPGSHKHRRRPSPNDNVEDQLVAIEAPQGSIVLINDATWHGSLPSTVPGLRVGMALRYARPYIWRREAWDDIPAGYLDGKPQRLKELMGGFVFTTQDHGPKDLESFSRFPPYPSVYS